MTWLFWVMAIVALRTVVWFALMWPNRADQQPLVVDEEDISWP